MNYPVNLFLELQTMDKIPSNSNQGMYVCSLLYSLGLTPNYKGFSQLAYALSLCVEDQHRLQMVTKQLYPEIAKRYTTTWTAVERNIRTAISVVWYNNRSLLEHLAGRPLQQKPFSAQFLAILSYYLISHRGSPSQQVIKEPSIS